MAEAYALRHTPVKGEARTLLLKIEGEIAEVPLVSEATIASKVTEVADDGGYTEEQTTTTTKFSINGEEGELEPATTKTIKYDARGHEIDAKETLGETEAFGLAFDYEADKPVEIGGEYRPSKPKASDPDRLEWTLVGKEDLNGKPVLHLKADGTGPKGAKIVSDVYLDPATSLLVKGVAKITGLEQEGVPGTGSFTITIAAKD